MTRFSTNKVDLERFSVATFITTEYQLISITPQCQASTLRWLPGERIALGQCFKAWTTDYHCFLCPSHTLYHLFSDSSARRPGRADRPAARDAQPCARQRRSVGQLNVLNL